MSGPASRRGFLRGITTFPLVGMAVIDPSLAANDQDPLVPLGREYDASRLAWDAYFARPAGPDEDQDSRDLDAIHGAMVPVELAMIGLSAMSLEGLDAKLRVIDHCLGEDTIDTVMGEGNTTDHFMAWSIIRDLLAWRGIRPA